MVVPSGWIVGMTQCNYNMYFRLRFSLERLYGLFLVRLGIMQSLRPCTYDVCLNFRIFEPPPSLAVPNPYKLPVFGQKLANPPSPSVQMSYITRWGMKWLSATLILPPLVLAPLVPLHAPLSTNSSRGCVYLVLTGLKLYLMSFGILQAIINPVDKMWGCGDLEVGEPRRICRNIEKLKIL